MRENKTKISVIAHNLLRFDFFFLLKGLRAGVWKTRETCIGGKNLTNINFTNIGNQVTFIDTIKYFQQSLGMLASDLTDNEKFAIRTECEKFIKKDENLSKKFNSCLKEDQEWILDYLSTGQRTIPYQMKTRHNSLDITPDDGIFFFHIIFIQTLKMM